MTHNTSTTVPQKLVALVNRLGPFWAAFPDDDTEARQLRGERCAEFLKNEGASIVEIWPAGGGFINVLAGFEVDDRHWVVWTGIDACGVDPCRDLTIEAMAECYAESNGDHYVWEPPAEPETPQFTASLYGSVEAAQEAEAKHWLREHRIEVADRVRELESPETLRKVADLIGHTPK